MKYRQYGAGHFDTGRFTFIQWMFSNEGLGGGGQRAQKGGRMAGTLVGTGGWARYRVGTQA
jgi:hypothetical protein